MTIYSQHPNRGKVQILATYRGPGGIVSSTVTSVDDTTAAAPIVDALNRISAYATLPHCGYRGTGGGGTRLRDELAEYSENIQVPDEDNRQLWDFRAPFVAPDEELAELSDTDRRGFDRVERSSSEERLARGVADLRLLLDAYERCANDEIRILVDSFSITDDPFDPFETDADRFFLCVRSAPPTVTEIIELLNRSGGQEEQLAAWSKTPVGETLAGTAFVVTDRYDD